MIDHQAVPPRREPWNKGKLVGQEAPFKLKDIWAIRVRLQLNGRKRDLALWYRNYPSDARNAVPPSVRNFDPPWKKWVLAGVFAGEGCESSQFFDNWR